MGCRQTFRVLILRGYSIPAVKGDYSDFICSLWFQLLSVPQGILAPSYSLWPETHSDLNMAVSYHKQRCRYTWTFFKGKTNSVIYDICFSSFDVFLRRRVGALSPSPSLFLPNLLRPKIWVQSIKITQVCIVALFAPIPTSDSNLLAP